MYSHKYVQQAPNDGNYPEIELREGRITPDLICLMGGTRGLSTIHSMHWMGCRSSFLWEVT